MRGTLCGFVFAGVAAVMSACGGSSPSTSTAPSATPVSTTPQSLLVATMDGGTVNTTQVVSGNRVRITATGYYPLDAPVGASYVLTSTRIPAGTLYDLVFGSGTISGLSHPGIQYKLTNNVSLVPSADILSGDPRAMQNLQTAAPLFATAVARIVSVITDGNAPSQIVPLLIDSTIPTGAQTQFNPLEVHFRSIGWLDVATILHELGRVGGLGGYDPDPGPMNKVPTGTAYTAVELDCFKAVQMNPIGATFDPTTGVITWN